MNNLMPLLQLALFIVTLGLGSQANAIVYEFDTNDYLRGTYIKDEVTDVLSGFDLYLTNPNHHNVHTHATDGTPVSTLFSPGYVIWNHTDSTGATESIGLIYVFTDISDGKDTFSFNWMDQFRGGRTLGTNTIVDSGVLTASVQQSAVSSVPEPTTYAMLTLGLVMLVGVGRRERS